MKRNRPYEELPTYRDDWANYAVSLIAVINYLIPIKPVNEFLFKIRDVEENIKFSEVEHKF